MICTIPRGSSLDRYLDQSTQACYGTHDGDFVVTTH